MTPLINLAQCALYGNFSAPKTQEILVSRGKVLELLRPDESGRVQVVYSTEVFGVIRSLQSFRFPGSQQDFVIAGSDSGRIVILQYNKSKGCFTKLHQETFGKSGVRRIVPGQHLAADPKGRACLIGALEKQKFVYVLNRDSEARLTISSPLEAHKSGMLCFAVTALDVGFDNPLFAAIELDVSEADQDPSGEAAAQAQKHLTLYELDLGLNHVVRKYSEPVDNGANLLLPVPGGGEGPGGVVVCAENFLIWMAPDQPEVRTMIPRRNDLPGERGVLITATATHKQKNLFFMLVQSEYGDIYKVTLDYEGEKVTQLKCKYFDTIPTAASLCVLRKGFLFAASEAGDHSLYQFQGLGDDDSVETSNITLIETEQGYQPVFFTPREFRNLELIDRIGSLAPLIDMKVANLLNEEVPQIYAACGRGPRSTLRVLKPGAAVSEMAVSPLPGAPTGVWTVKVSHSDSYDGYMVVSFAGATLVLSVGETVEEVTDTGFSTDCSTMTVQLLSDDSFLQVMPTGLRHIRPDKRVQEWKAPGRKTVSAVATNERQVALTLAGGELLYFELNAQGLLVEVEKKELGSEVASLAVGPLPEGRQRSRFLAVSLYDGTVRLLSLDPGDTLATLSTQAVGATAVSLLFLAGFARGTWSDAEAGGIGSLFLQIGLQNGILLRTEVDPVMGTLSDTRRRFLGTRPPKLVPCQVRGERAMLALSSRPWLGYSEGGRFTLTPLSYDALDGGAGFCSEQCPEGFVAVAKDSLRVLTLERLGEYFNQKVLKLRYTPRKVAIHPDYNVILVAEADCQAIPIALREDLPSSMATEEKLGPEEVSDNEERLGAPVGLPGQWASCLRVVDPVSLTTLQCLELDDNEAALSVALVAFDAAPELGTLLAVGTAKNLSFYPKSADCGFIHLYQLVNKGRTLSLVHKTQVEDIPGAIVAFKGRLLAGIGSTLRLFDYGKKRLLRKCEFNSLPTRIAVLAAQGNRIFVGDAQESFFFMKYKRSDNTLYIFADEVVPRHITAGLDLDPDTVVGADRYGNVCVLRLPDDASAAVEADPTGGRFNAKGELGLAAHRLHAECNFHVGEMVTSVARGVLQPGGREVLLYGTIHGTIGALFPLSNKADADFFQHLEIHLRSEAPPLLGRDHQAYRSAYFPVRNVIDGDLCEQYALLAPDRARAVAQEMDRTSGEVLRKLEDIRNRII